jgi:hypothetical protein
MGKPQVTEREVRFARSFLKNIGGNQTSGYLLMAVIAWLRTGLKMHDKFMVTLKHYSAVEAGRRLAQKLRARIKAAPIAYKGLLKRIHGTPKGDVEQYNQARDFLEILANSTWDPGHYGYKPYVPEHTVRRELPNGSFETIVVPAQPEVPAKFIKLYDALLGVKIPDKWFVDTVSPAKTVTTVKKQPPSQPRSLLHAFPAPNYIMPYAARIFYEAKPHIDKYVLDAGDVLD